MHLTSAWRVISLLCMATKPRASVYVLLTKDKIHAYGTHSRALKIYQRAQRMGVKGVEFCSALVRTGDPYTKASLADPWSTPTFSQCMHGG